MTDRETNAGPGDADDEEYALSPAEPDVVDRQPSVPPGGTPEAPAGSRFQYSLADLLLLVAFVALVLGLLGYFPRKYAAGLAGLGALLSLIILDVLKPTRTIVYIGWWTMLGIYLLSCIAALLTGG